MAISPLIFVLAARVVEVARNHATMTPSSAIIIPAHGRSIESKRMSMYGVPDRKPRLEQDGKSGRWSSGGISSSTARERDKHECHLGIYPRGRW